MGDARALTRAEREDLVAAIVADTTADYVVVRALIALGEDAPERLARATGMGREFVAHVRWHVEAGRVSELLRKRPNVAERLMEAATANIVASGGRELSIAEVALAVGIARRTLHRQYTARSLSEASRRRAMTIWRCRLVHRVRVAHADAAQRLFGVIDALVAWSAADRFRSDLVLWPKLSADQEGEDLRDHLAAIARFTTSLAEEAAAADPRALGAFVALNVAGAAAWLDHADGARDAALAFIARTVGMQRLP